MDEKRDILCGISHASDPEGDELRYEITEYPAKGLVTLDSAAGKYEYTPYSGASGTDSFSYRACNSYGNYSAESAVSLKIEKSDSEIVFSDMAGYPGYAAAVSLVSEGIMDAKEGAGNEMLFDPSEKVSRLEFLVCAMDAFGAGNIPSSSDAGFADTDTIPEKHRGYVSAAKSLGIVSGVNEGGRMYFRGDEEITYAQAAVILNRIIGLESDGTKSLSADVPEWAYRDVCALTENGILDPYCNVSASVDRAGCAQIVCEAVRFFD